MDAASELGGFIQIETRCEERGVEEQPNQILHGLVRFVSSCLLPEKGFFVSNPFPLILSPPNNKHLRSIVFIIRVVFIIKEPKRTLIINL
jgi:UPF0716 family protein affecting phage T7 exclusion